MNSESVKPDSVSLRAILLFVLDRPGVLNKISMLIRRKMYNIDTITVCAAKQPGISRMTITLKETDNDKVTQISKQIEKLTEVIVAKELDRDESFWREVAIIKTELKKKRIEDLTLKYNFEIISEQNQEVFLIQISGTSRYIDDFMADIGDDEIIEIARSGVTAMEK